MARDYNNYDYLAVSVKSDQLNRILHCYRALGWTEVKTVDDREYYNMKYVRLRRPHKIANKDRLQYLQVRMEGAINSLVEIVNRAHLKSNAAAGGLGLLAAGLIALAVWLVIYFTSAIRVLGWVCLGVGCALIVVAVAVRAGLRRRERKVASGKIMEKLRLTQSLIEEAVSLAPAKEGVADGLDEPAAHPEANNG